MEPSRRGFKNKREMLIWVAFLALFGVKKSAIADRFEPSALRFLANALPTKLRWLRSLQSAPACYQSKSPKSSSKGGSLSLANAADVLCVMYLVWRWEVDQRVTLHASFGTNASLYRHAHALAHLIAPSGNLHERFGTWELHETKKYYPWRDLNPQPPD